MTQTVSFSDRLRKGFTVFKWELRNCSGALLIFAILATVFGAVILTLALAAGYLDSTEDSLMPDIETLRTAVLAFQLITTYVIFYLNAIFTIIYTIRIYSYLHNKRKADMYGALPVGRRTFFIAKTVSAYLLSVVPTLFFFGIIAVISLCFGQPLLTETISAYVQLLLGSIACISFYALLAVCCGTTVNAVLIFAAVNVAYPIAALFIKGTIMAFFYGLPANTYNNSFIMKALNPLAAYGGSNVIYWLIFTAACLALGIWLVKKRRAECAQTSFAYFLPAYIVKLLVAFIIGMFLGTVFGSLNVLGFPLLGFVFGFMLGSAPAYLIAHIIFYRGLNRFPKTIIAFGAMSAVVIAAVGFCFFDVFGYNSFVPTADSVESAGVVATNENYFTGKTSLVNIARMAADDYSDAETVRGIARFHQSVLRCHDKEGKNRFANVWGNMLLGSFSDELFSDNSYIISYKLKNGMVVMRHYSDRSDLFSGYSFYDLNTDIVDEIVSSQEYYRRYSAIMNAEPDEISAVSVNRSAYTSAYSFESTGTGVIIAENEGKVGARQAAADRNKVIEAFRKDCARLDGKRQSADRNEEKGVLEDDLYKDDLYIHIRYTIAEPDTGNPLTNLFVSLITQYDKGTDTGRITSDYTETLAALREIGVLDKDNKIDPNSVYYR